MAELPVTPERLEHLSRALRLHDAEARIVRQTVSGRLEAGDTPWSLKVGGTEVQVPEGATIAQGTWQTRPTIEINSDMQPVPPGTWVRVVCEAAKESNTVLKVLEGL